MGAPSLRHYRDVLKMRGLLGRIQHGTAHCMLRPGPVSPTEILHAEKYNNVLPDVGR
jgi:hypothetical protein